MTEQLDHSIRAALEEIGDHAPRAADVRSPRQVSERPLALVGATSNRVDSRTARPSRLVLIGLATAVAFTGLAVINSGTADPGLTNVATVSPVRFSLTSVQPQRCLGTRRPIRWCCWLPKRSPPGIDRSLHVPKRRRLRSPART